MYSEEAIEGLIHKIRDEAGPYSEAKGRRVYLEHYRQSLLAMIIQELEAADKDGTAHNRLEAKARADRRYVDLLRELQEAVVQEELSRLRVKAAEYQVEVWRTKQANMRMERSSYNA